MANRLQVLQELDRRGALPEKYRGAFDEAVRRGLVAGRHPEQPAEPDEERGGLIDSVAHGVMFGYSDEAKAGVRAPFIAGRRALIDGEPFDMGKAYDEQLEKARGDLAAYQERNPIASTAGEIGGAALSGAVGGAGALVGKGAGILAKTGLAAAEGAGYGGLYGFGTGEGGAKNRLASAADSAAVGAVTGAAIPAAGVAAGKIVGKAAELLKRIGLGVDGVPKAAARRVADAITDDGLTNMDDAIASAGPAGRLYNAGPTLRANAEGLAQLPGPQMKVIEEAAKEQMKTSTFRVRRALDHVLGKPEDMTKFYDDALAELRKRADILYRRAGRFARPVDVSEAVEYIDTNLHPGMARLTRDDVADDNISSALNSVKRLLTNKTGQKVDLGLLHRVQSEVNDKAVAANRSGHGYRASLLWGVRDHLLKAMDEATTDHKGFSLYRKARDTFSHDNDVLEAMQDGQSVFKRNMRANEVRKKLRAMSRAEQVAFQKGARDEIAHLMDSARITQKGNADAQAAWKALLTDENKAKLDLIVGSKKSERLQDILRQELKLSADYNQLLSNSATGRRQAVQGTIPQPGRRDRSAPSAYGRLENIVTGAADTARGIVRDSAIKRENEAVADLLTRSTTDEITQELVNLALERQNAQAAGQAADRATQSVVNKGTAVPAPLGDRIKRPLIVNIP